MCHLEYKDLDPLILLTVFHIRVRGHSPIWVSDAKINSPRWKFTWPDEQITFINITDENNNIYYLIYCLFAGTNVLHHLNLVWRLLALNPFGKKQSLFKIFYFLSTLAPAKLGEYFWKSLTYQ